MAREKGTTIHRRSVTLKGVEFLFRADFPQTESLIGRTAEDTPPMARKGNTIHKKSVSVERLHAFTRGQRPNLYSFVVRTADGPLVGPNVTTPNTFGMSAKDSEGIATLYVP